MADHPVIPLFPLEIVVFPGQALSLHIFEDRYKLMVAECRANGNQPFGISLRRDSEVCRAGCAVVIQEILHEYGDGRLDLVAVGQRRFRILETYEDRPYLSAAVEFFDDGEEEADADLVSQAEERFLQLLSLVGAGAEMPEVWSSFHLAYRAGMDLDRRQHLLEMTSENQRLRFLVEYFDQLLPALEQRREMRKRAQSNGRPKSL